MGGLCGQVGCVLLCRHQVGGKAGDPLRPAAAEWAMHCSHVTADLLTASLPLWPAGHVQHWAHVPDGAVRNVPQPRRRGHHPSRRLRCAPAGLTGDRVVCGCALGMLQKPTELQSYCLAREPRLTPCPHPPCPTLAAPQASTT